MTWAPDVRRTGASDTWIGTVGQRIGDLRKKGVQPNQDVTQALGQNPYARTGDFGISPLQQLLAYYYAGQQQQALRPEMQGLEQFRQQMGLLSPQVPIWPTQQQPVAKPAPAGLLMPDEREPLPQAADRAWRGRMGHWL